MLVLVVDECLQSMNIVLVLVVDESTMRGHWPKAFVQEGYPEANGLVRRVRVRTADTQNLIRDIRKICFLEGSVQDCEVEE